MQMKQIGMVAVHAKNCFPAETVYNIGKGQRTL